MDAKSFWHLNSHKYKTYWVVNSIDDKIVFEKSDDLWRYMNDFFDAMKKELPPQPANKEPDNDKE